MTCSKVCGHCHGHSCLSAESTNDEYVDVNLEMSSLDVLSVTITDRETEDIDNE